jgi:hypothetical protein
LLKFCLDVVGDQQYPEETRIKANGLLVLKLELQSRAASSPKEKQAKAKESEALYKRMDKFRNENQ